MIRALYDMRAGVTGVFAMLMFKKDWRQHFDVSPEGVARSFSGIILALPAFAFLIFGVNYFVADNPANMNPEASITLGEAAISWARFWLLFPLTSALMVILLDRKSHYGSWLVVHNWTVFVLVHIQALILALYPAGLADLSAIGGTIAIYQLARLFVHWRVAHATLGLPPVLAAAAASVPLIIDWMVLSLT